MSRRSTQAFSLLEALAMIVTLFVFGWLCVGVVRYDLKNQDSDPRANVKFTTQDIEGKANTKTVKAEPQPVKTPVTDEAKAPVKQSLPAGSSAPAKP